MRGQKSRGRDDIIPSFLKKAATLESRSEKWEGGGGRVYFIALFKGGITSVLRQSATLRRSRRRSSRVWRGPCMLALFRWIRSELRRRGG